MLCHQHGRCIKRPAISQPASSPWQRAQVDVGEIWNPSAENPSASVSIAISGSLSVIELVRLFASVDESVEATPCPGLVGLLSQPSKRSGITEWLEVGWSVG